MPDRRFVLATLATLALAAPTLKAADIPRTPDDLAITLAGGKGKQVTLSQYKGKVVAVLFILTTCPHCESAVQCLIRYQKEFGPRGFQAIASAVEEQAETSVPEFISRLKPPFPVGYSGLKPSMDFMQHPPKETPHMPLIAFIDRRGILRAQYEGMDPFFVPERMAQNIHDRIAALLGGGAPAKAQPKK
jgi:thiol-disulfide isomerase/thioredoxin